MTDSLNTVYMQAYLEKNLQDARALLGLLADEREALSANQADRIESLAATKFRLAREIETATQHCNRLLEQAGLEASNAGLESYFLNCGEPYSTSFSQLWQQCQDVLAECREENHVNGKLIESSKRRIKQAISILQGQPVEEDLYGRHGNAVQHATGSSLTRA